MAQKIITVYTDDLTGEEAEEARTHNFSIDGVAYEIDLAPDSYEQMLQAFGPFVKAARKQGKGRKPTGRISVRSSEDTAAIRKWAKENGYSVNDRGRVPADIREAYAKAQQ
ncbi:Lsr2 family protein [Streptomyces roseoverticillatus]|uniref:histone-like nucleoid-structuring protein Lsr2 n=1 Tax=Streptomyces roseoverticillatus TaxID=66429 RepID=UPI001F2989C0|nr:Lsr2 family protein [Streptomyces roseoverticillatus]MCF3100996.1 Lsr2 family protein [Streptomyces roseoverticillatus]